MATYAQVDDVAAYIEGFVVDDAAGLERILVRAERDVDGILRSPMPEARQPNGLKYDPTKLEVWRAAALTRAVCAQVEYRIQMGPDFFVEAQHQSVRGPEFSTSGVLPYIGPMVCRELAGTALERPEGFGTIPVAPTVR